MSKHLSFQIRKASLVLLAVGFADSSLIVVFWPVEFRLRWGY